MKYNKFGFIVATLVIAFALLFSPRLACAAEEEGEFDAGPFIIEHVTDSYGWHICGDGDKSVTIPLPIILIDNGLQVFSSAKLHHGEAAYKSPLTVAKVAVDFFE